MNLKKKLLSCAAMALMFKAVPAAAGTPWVGTILGAVGLVYSSLMTFMNGGNVVQMVAVNTDPLQLAAEAGVYHAMTHINDVWKPKPAEMYEDASVYNGFGDRMEFVPENGLENKMDFRKYALRNVGIEAINVGADLASIIGARSTILGGLEYFKLPTTSGTATTASCSYSICPNDRLTTAQKNVITQAQNKNLQWYGTAGIAHAELGLKVVRQAIVDDDGALAQAAETSPSRAAVTTSFATTTGKSASVQNLAGLITQARNTYNAMTIVSMMNLELAQRLNQGLMLQGSSLVIEAARAFPKTGSTN